MKKPIRVGIVRADTHGAYFAALMAPHDPLKFQRPVPVEADPPHSWMNGAAHYYFYQCCADPTLMTVDTVDGFEIVKVWDDFTESAERLSEALNSHPQVCGNFEDVSEDVDLVFIEDCNGDGSDHLKLATPESRKESRPTSTSRWRIPWKTCGRFKPWREGTTFALSITVPCISAPMAPRAQSSIQKISMTSRFLTARRRS